MKFSVIMNTPRTCIKVENKIEGAELETYMHSIGKWIFSTYDDGTIRTVGANGYTVYIPSEETRINGTKFGAYSYFVDEEGYESYDYKDIIKDVSPYRDIKANIDFLEYGLFVVLRNGLQYQLVENKYTGDKFLYSDRLYTLDGFMDNLTHNKTSNLDIVKLMDREGNIVWDRWDNYLDIKIDKNNNTTLVQYETTTETIKTSNDESTNSESIENLSFLEKLSKWFKNLF